MKQNMGEVNVLDVFKRWAADPALLVMAVHTTDFNGEVIEVAVVDSGGNAVLNTRVKPVTAMMSAKAQEVHGIALEDLKNTMGIEAVWPTLSDLILTHKVIAYSPDFIVKVLKRSLMLSPDKDRASDHRALIKLNDDEQCSVIEAYSFIAGRPSSSGAGFSYVKLLEAAEDNRLALPGPQASALDNARLCLELVKACADMTPEDVPHLLPAAHVVTPEVQPPAPLEVPDLPRGERWTDTTSALFHLVSLGWVRRLRPEFYDLPDHSLHFTFLPRQLKGGIDKSIDCFIRAACELQTSKRDGEWTLTLGMYRIGGQTLWIASLFHGLDQRATLSGQASAGLAVMNLLDKAGWLA